MRILKGISLLVSGILIGIFIPAPFSSSSIEKSDNRFTDSYSNQYITEQDRESGNNKNITAYDKTTEASVNILEQVSDTSIPDVLLRLIKERSILTDDLEQMSLWVSFEEFIHYIDQFSLSDFQYHSLLAKAHSYYHKDYVLALEELYNAKRHANHKAGQRFIEGQLNRLVEFISEAYFTSRQDITQEQFVNSMYFLYEKEPDNLRVIRALIKHHLLLHDFSYVESLIESIPDNLENQPFKSLFKKRLENTRAMSSEQLKKGIKLIQRGDHYAVPVNFSDDFQVKLLLDTGASKTTLPRHIIRTLSYRTNDLLPLDVIAYADTANGRTAVDVYQIDYIKVGEFRLDKPLIIGSNFVMDDDIYGLLGMDFLKHFQFRIDHQSHRLYLSH